MLRLLLLEVIFGKSRLKKLEKKKNIFEKHKFFQIKLEWNSKIRDYFCVIDKKNRSNLALRQIAGFLFALFLSKSMPLPKIK